MFWNWLISCHDTVKTLIFFRKHKGDHGYATLSECRTLDQESSTSKTNQTITDTPQMTDNNQNTDENIPKDSEENQNNTCKNGESEENNAMTESNGDVKNVNISQADDLRVQVSHEHSYGTKRDSSPETDQVIHVNFGAFTQST